MPDNKRRFLSVTRHRNGTVSIHAEELIARTMLSHYGALCLEQSEKYRKAGNEELSLYWQNAYSDSDRQYRKLDGG